MHSILSLSRTSPAGLPTAEEATEKGPGLREGGQTSIRAGSELPCRLL